MYTLVDSVNNWFIHRYEVPLTVGNIVSKSGLLINYFGRWQGCLLLMPIIYSVTYLYDTLIQKGAVSKFCNTILTQITPSLPPL